MAKRPDGKPATVEKVTFTRPAAERIARVVRTVEQGDRDAPGFGLGVRLQGGVSAKQIRVVTFTGSWSKDSAKTVTFKFQTTTPNTVSATNLLCAIDGDTASTSASTVAIIGKDGTAWYYINHECNTASCTLTLGNVDLATLSGFAAGEEQVLGKSVDDCLKWFSITTCATATATP